jgi:tight adherence protein B
LEREASFVSLRLGGSSLLRLQITACGGFLALAAAFGSWSFVVVAVATAVAPVLMLRRRHLARVARLEQQLDGWLLLLANALRATPSVGDAIESTAALTPGELGREVQLLVKELRLGVPVDRALRSLAERVKSNVISAAMTTVVVARRTGGDLATALEESAASLRETARLEALLRTKTAEGRGQVVVLAAAPFLLCGLIAWLEPTWFDATLHSSQGNVMLGGCTLLWLVATLWAHRIVGVPL